MHTPAHGGALRRAAVRLTTPRLEGVIWKKKGQSKAESQWREDGVAGAIESAVDLAVFSYSHTGEAKKKKKKASPDILHRSSLSIRKIDFFFCGDPKDRLILSKKKTLTKSSPVVKTASLYYACS
jgi:hypothetical protein